MKKSVILILILLLILLPLSVNCKSKQAPSPEPTPSPIIPAPKNKEQLNIYEGSILFWIEKGEIQYNDNQFIVLQYFNTNEGNISIVKDAENKLRVSHVINGRGKTDLVYDVSSLSSEQAHHFGITWSVESNEINLYIDGQCVAFAQILSEIRHRQTNPSPEIDYDEIHIPDDRDLGTGSHIIVTKPNAFSNNKAIASIIINKPVFQISVNFNPASKEIIVLLGFADGSDPISRKTYLFPENMNVSNSHEFEVTFKNWEITGLSMDGVVLKLKESFRNGTTV